MRGYGTVGGPFGAQGVDPEQPVSPQETSNDIREIREKYVGPPVEDVLPFSLTAGQSFKWNDPSVQLNSMILNVTQGTANVFLGDFTGNVNAAAHISVPSGGPAIPYPLTDRPDRIITICNPTTAAATLIGCLIVQRL